MQQPQTEHKVSTQSTSAPEPQADPKPWDRRATENNVWYDRFLTYLALGPGRTVEETFRQRKTIEKALNAARPTGYWHTRASTYEWELRATAYDQERQTGFLAVEESRRLEARERRRLMVEELLGKVHCAIGAAELDAMDIITARRNLPTLRALLHDLLMAHRLEMGEPTEIQQEMNSNDLTFSADDLAEAQRQLAADLEEALKSQAPPEAAPVEHKPTLVSEDNRHLLVIIGADANLNLDLAILRGVSQRTGLQWHRLVAPTKDELEAELLRARRAGVTSQYMHMAVHADAHGITLADGTADGDWLSERLLGVKVLVIAGCKSTALGDWLSVVPYVVSFREEISHQNASAFTDGFWTAIALDRTPEEALEEALRRCMPTTREYVHKHW